MNAIRTLAARPTALLDSSINETRQQVALNRCHYAETGTTLKIKLISRLVGASCTWRLAPELQSLLLRAASPSLPIQAICQPRWRARSPAQTDYVFRQIRGARPGRHYDTKIGEYAPRNGAV